MLRWELEHGRNAKRFEQLERDGGDVPDAWRNRPKIEARDVWAFHAFTALSGSRSTTGGMAPSPLPIAVSEVLAYCNLASIAEGWPRMAFARLVRALDAVYLEHAAVAAGRR